MFSNAQSIASKGLEFDRNIPDSAEMIADKIDEKNFFRLFCHFHHVNPPPEIGRKSPKIGCMSVKSAEISVRVQGGVKWYSTQAKGCLRATLMQLRHLYQANS